jgi:predicted MPP superfamily phosphohydrolase
VNGSNDYHAPEIRNPAAYLNKPSTPSHKELIDSAKLTDAFENAGWKNLNNASASLLIGGTRIGFLGLDDPHDKLAKFETLGKQRSELGQADLVLGVAHAPYLKVIDEFGGHGAELVFAGHTHGGHLGLVSLGLDWTVIGAFAGIPDHGAWARGRDRLYVHRASGHYGFPLRLGVPIEESVLEVEHPAFLT